LKLEINGIERPAAFRGNGRKAEETTEIAEKKNTRPVKRKVPICLPATQDSGQNRCG